MGQPGADEAPAAARSRVTEETAVISDPTGF